ncbi:hypothetical protein F0232_15775 [Vibrio sp. T3Y01]|nr:hypothetical protein [Vibrio sp. T3Y01]
MPVSKFLSQLNEFINPLRPIPPARFTCIFGGYRYSKKYNHLTCGSIRLFDSFYKKKILNTLNITHLKFETPLLTRTSHEANTRNNIPTPSQQSHPCVRRTTSPLGFRSQTTKHSVAT